jgi:hypothetical protein
MPLADTERFASVSRSRCAGTVGRAGPVACAGPLSRTGGRAVASNRIGAARCPIRCNAIGRGSSGAISPARSRPLSSAGIERARSRRRADRRRSIHDKHSDPVARSGVCGRTECGGRRATRAAPQGHAARRDGCAAVSRIQAAIDYAAPTGRRHHPLEHAQQGRQPRRTGNRRRRRRRLSEDRDAATRQTPSKASRGLRPSSAR